MDSYSKIYLENKPSSFTSNDFSDIIKKREKLKKICYCGRLDPMARGQMLLLGDEKCKEMDKHLNHDKTYQFSIKLGIQTDTDDFLGIVEDYKILDKNQIEVIYDKLLQELNNHPLEFNQKFHNYSSKVYNGKPLWLNTKEKINITELPEHKVKIKDIKILGRYESVFEYFINSIIETIEDIDVKHDFRQEKIIDQWINFPICFQTIHSIKLELTVSSGFYIRQFVRDLSNKINFPLVVHDINRTKIFI